MNALPRSTQQKLTGYSRLIRSVILSGYQDYFENYARQAACHSSRTRASIIHDHQRDRAKRAFASLDEKWRYHELHTRGMFIFDDFILGFKKLSPELLPSNIPTQTSLFYAEQLTLDGIPPSLPRVIAGYVPNSAWTGVVSTHLVYRSGLNISWSLCLDEEGSGILKIPVEPVSYHGTAKRTKLRAKKQECTQLEAVEGAGA